MDFGLTKQQELVRQMVREFAINEVEPLAAEIDISERFPRETVEKMARYNMMGIPIATKYGGAGGDILSYAIAVEELSKACATTGVILSAHTSLCIGPLDMFGTE
ncbi:MAG: acyl-CoA dehydrogenase family protein, partial [Clostridium sp.]